jgi:putative ABC transport system permease protein
VKPTEAEHDSELYRLYQRAADEIESKGGRVLRVQLDYELKEQLYRKLGRGYAGTTLVIKTKSNPATFVAAVREAINQTDGSVPIYDVNTMDGLMAASLQRRKFAAALLTLFAGLALGLASIGLYAVLSYVVARRTREIGIRIAIGASRDNVLLLIFRSGLTMAVSGLVLGLGLALLLKPLIASELFGVQPLDVLTLSLASLLLVMTAMLASYVPANRAMRVDPIVALRHE